MSDSSAVELQDFSTVPTVCEQGSRLWDVQNDSPVSTASPASAAATASSPDDGRDMKLDALRGICALLVVLHHFESAFGAKYLDNWFLRILVHGKMNVAVFFVLSGNVLLKRYMTTGNMVDLACSVFKRIPRLAMPILGASVVECAIANVGGFISRQQPPFDNRTGWWCNTNECWTTNLPFAMMTSVPDFTRGHALCAVIWSMRLELLGSFYVYLAAPAVLFILWLSRRFLGESKQRDTITCCLVHVTLLCVLAALSFSGEDRQFAQPWRVLFLFEAGLAFEHVRIVSFIALPDGPRARLVKGGLGGLLIFLGFLSIGFLPNHWGAQYTLIDEDYVCAAGIAIVFGTILVPSCPCLEVQRFLGEISFALYLNQGSVLFSVGARLFAAFRNRGLSVFASQYLSVAICMPILIAISFAFWKAWEQPLAVEGPRWLWKLLMKHIRAQGGARFTSGRMAGGEPITLLPPQLGHEEPTP